MGKKIGWLVVGLVALLGLGLAFLIVLPQVERDVTTAPPAETTEPPAAEPPAAEPPADDSPADDPPERVPRRSPETDAHGADVSPESVLRAEDHGVVRGRVLRRTDSSPVAGATVHVVIFRMLGAGAGPPPATTATDGSFRVEGVAPGPGRAFVLGGGWASSHLHAVAFDGFGPLRFELRAGAEVVLDLEVDPTASIGGRVLLPDGNGAPGVAVLASPRWRADWMGERAQLETTTDATGGFVMRGLAVQGPWAIRARSDRHVGPTVVVEPRAEENTPIVLQLETACAVQVTVRDSTTGDPIEGARVTKWERQDIRWSSSGETPKAVGAGVARFGPLPIAAHAFTAAAPGHIPTDLDQRVEVSAEALSDGIEEVEIHLAPGAVIAGRVLWPDGSQAARVTVTATPGAAPKTGADGDMAKLLREMGIAGNDVAGRCVTDGRGAFRMDTLAPGKYRVLASVHRDEVRHDTEVVAETGGAALGLKLVRREGTEESDANRIQVRVVTADGTEVGDGTLTEWTRRPGMSGSSGTNYRPGGTWVERAEAGPKSLQLLEFVRPRTTDRTPVPWGAVRVELTADTPDLLEITLPAERVFTGRVIDEAAEAVGGVRVVARPTVDGIGKPWSGMSDAGSHGDAVTAADGTFRIGRLGEFEYEFVVHVPPGFAKPAPIAVGAARDGVTVPIQRVGGVVVTVVDADGAPVPGVTVGARVDARRWISAVTAQDGRATLEGLDPARPAELNVTGESREKSWFRFQQADWLPQNTRVVLERALSITGRVVDEAGRAIPDAYVVRPNGHGGWGGGGVQDDGSFQITGLRAGETVRLKAQLGAFGPTAPSREDDGVEVVAGTEGVLLRLRLGAKLRVKMTGRRAGHGRLLLSGKPVKQVDGERGELRFVGLDMGTAYDLWIPPDYDGRYVLRRAVMPSAETLTVAAVQGAPLGGRVLLPEGMAVRAHVRATLEPGVIASISSDREGRFLFRGLPPGTWKLTVRTATQPGYTGSVTATTGDENVEIELTETR